jgi:hypothetical protein
VILDITRECLGIIAPNATAQVIGVQVITDRTPALVNMAGLITKGRLAAIAIPRTLQLPPVQNATIAITLAMTMAAGVMIESYLCTKNVTVPGRAWSHFLYTVIRFVNWMSFQIQMKSP